MYRVKLAHPHSKRIPISLVTKQFKEFPTQKIEFFDQNSIFHFTVDLWYEKCACRIYIDFMDNSFRTIRVGALVDKMHFLVVFKLFFLSYSYQIKLENSEMRKVRCTNHEKR